MLNSSITHSQDGINQLKTLHHRTLAILRTLAIKKLGDLMSQCMYPLLCRKATPRQAPSMRLYCSIIVKLRVTHFFGDFRYNSEADDVVVTIVWRFEPTVKIFSDKVSANLDRTDAVLKVFTEL